MIIRIDTTSAVPVYAQIVQQVKRAIAVGALKPGDSIDSLRETAAKLRVNPLTVSKAYKLLEQDGLLESKQGLGSFVASNVAIPTEEFKRDCVSAGLDMVFSDASHLGMNGQELRNLIEERLGRYGY
ncbi:MAG TPA: GntR family transcriptional regulator [Armatimonadota bacterium]|jgi:GntR family transcriptional regulator